MSNFSPRTLNQMADAFGIEKYRQPTKEELNEGGWRQKSTYNARIGPDGGTEVPIYERIDQEEKEEKKAEDKPAAPAPEPPKPEVKDKPKVQEAVQRAKTHLQNKSEVSVMPAGDDETANVRAEFDASQGIRGIG